MSGLSDRADLPTEGTPPRGRGRGGQRGTSVLRLPLPGVAPGGAPDIEPERALARPEAPEAADLALALERAAGRVADEWQVVVSDGLSREEVVANLLPLCAAVRAAAFDQSGQIPSPPPTIPLRRMLDLVRRALVVELAAGAAPDPAELVRLLGGMERVAEQIDRDAAQRFASRLSGPDGLELMVEVAHDLRSPLTSILFLAETLHGARSGPINTVQERQLGLIYSAAFGLSSLANDVIELARGGDRLLDLDPLPFSVTDIMESVRDIIVPIAEEKRLTIRLQTPPADSRVGRPTALSRVLLNLATNALKFTDEGHVELTAEQVSPRLVEFSVRDTGRGLSADVLASLFEPFGRRYRPGQYTFSSSGLGLAICRRLVTAMGAELQVESSPAAGTRFHFTLDLPHAPRL